MNAAAHSDLDNIIVLAEELYEESENHFKTLKKAAYQRNIHFSKDVPYSIIEDALRLNEEQRQEVFKEVGRVRECDSCGSTNLQLNNKDYWVCRDCCVVQIEQEDRYSFEDRRVFSEEQRKGRIIREPTNPVGLRTDFSYAVNKVFNAKHKRLHKWHTICSVQNSLDRNLLYSRQLIHKIVINLNLPDYIEKLCEKIYIKSVKSRVVKGRSIESIAAASLWIALNYHKNVRFMKDIMSYFQINDKEFKSGLNAVIQRTLPSMGIKNYNSYNSILAYSNLVLNELGYGDRIGSYTEFLRLIIKYSINKSDKLSDDVKSEKLNKIKNYTIPELSNLFDKLFTGKSPLTISSALLYAYFKWSSSSLTQALISNKAKVTELSLRNNYKALVKRFKLEGLLKEE